MVVLHCASWLWRFSHGLLRNSLSQASLAGLVCQWLQTVAGLDSRLLRRRNRLVCLPLVTSHADHDVRFFNMSGCFRAESRRKNSLNIIIELGKTRPEAEINPPNNRALSIFAN